MSKEKEKAGDTPEELNMLFRKNRIYMLDFEHRTRKMYAYAYAAAASENDVKRVEERLIELQLRKDIEECQDEEKYHETTYCQTTCFSYADDDNDRPGRFEFRRVGK